MTAADILNICLLLSAAMLSLALCLTTLRIILGPTLADRVVGLDMLVALAICLITIQSIRTGNAFGLDIAMALAIAGFLATVAFARYILVRKGENDKSPSDPPSQAHHARKRGCGHDVRHPDAPHSRAGALRFVLCSGRSPRSGAAAQPLCPHARRIQGGHCGGRPHSSGFCARRT